MSSTLQEEEGADLVLTGGRVITMDPSSPSAEAVAVRNGRIMAVGTSDEINQLAGTKTESFNLDGLTVIPGFNDTHAHMDREGLKTQRTSLDGAQSIADILQRIAAVAAKTPAGEWIVTMPVGTPPCYFGGPETLAEGRMPTRQELDSVAPTIRSASPVFLRIGAHRPATPLSIAAPWRLMVSIAIRVRAVQESGSNATNRANPPESLPNPISGHSSSLTFCPRCLVSG